MVFIAAENLRQPAAERVSLDPPCRIGPAARRAVITP